MAYATAARAIPQGLRMAGQVLRNIGLTAAANPRLSATLGAGALGTIHGRVAGHNDPYSSGYGGALGYGLLGGALGGPAGAALGALAYGGAQDEGSKRGALSKLKALDQAVLAGNPVLGRGAPVDQSQNESDSYQDYLNYLTMQNHLRGGKSY